MEGLIFGILQYIIIINIYLKLCLPFLPFFLLIFFLIVSFHQHHVVPSSTGDTIHIIYLLSGPLWLSL